MYPYQQMYNPGVVTPQINPYMQPQQPPIQSQVTKVRGEQSARSINLAPNSSICLLDETEPIMWLCTSDGVGTVTAIPYDISPHQSKPQVNISDLESRVAHVEAVVARIEASISSMEVRNNGKSGDRSNKSKTNDGKHGADQTDVE